MTEKQIKEFKDGMINTARMSGGVYESFGQLEISVLKRQQGYNPYGTQEERETAKQIDELDNWCKNLDLSVIK